MVIKREIVQRLRRAASRWGRMLLEPLEAAARRLPSEARPLARPDPLPTFSSGGALVDVSDRDALDQATGADLPITPPPPR